MRLLAPWEAEELHLALLCRPRLWFYNGKRWIRHTGKGRNRYTLCLLPQPPSDFFHQVQLQELEGELGDVPQEALELISKLTSFGWRMQVEDLLRKETALSPARLENLALQISRPSMTEFVPQVVVSAAPAKARSRFLQKLLQ